MAIGSKELTTAALDAMDNEQLVAQIKKAKAELFNLRFQSATDQLDNHGRLKAVRKDVARIYTVIRERELGIRTTPTAAAPAVKDAKAPKKADKKAEAKTEGENEVKATKKTETKPAKTPKKEAK